MAGTISHWLLGRRILRERAFQEAFPDVDPGAFLWGCQGPDIFFYHRPLPWQSGSLRRYGAAIHRGDACAALSSLAKVCRYCSGRPEYNAVFSYALGFCSHYCFDRALHPLVNYNVMLMEKTDERGPDYRYHDEIENNLDLLLLRRDTGRTMDGFDMRECLPPFDGEDGCISLIWSLLLCDLFDVHTPRASSMTLAHDFRFVLGARNDNHQFKRSAAGIAEMLLPYIRPSAKKGSVRIRFHPLTPETDFDYANLSGSVWFHPDDVSQRSDMNFYDIVEQAQIWSTQLMELFAGEVTQKGSADFQLFTMGIDFNGRHSE